MVNASRAAHSSPFGFSCVWLSACCLWLLLLLPVPCRAQILHLIRYQGQAVDNQGVPLEGPYVLTFRLYDAATAGTKIWEETQANVPLAGGQFSVLLGQVTSLDAVTWNQPLWIGLQVGTDPELSPRQAITSVPMALRAETAEVAERLATPMTTSTITDDANKLIPSGAIILWDGAACPTGYTRLSAYDNRFLVGAAAAQVAGGSNTHDHGGATGSHALTVGEMPSHQHNMHFTGADGNVHGSFMSGSNAGGYNENQLTEATGGGGGHTHPIPPADSRPAFLTILLCKKD